MGAWWAHARCEHISLGDQHRNRQENGCMHIWEPNELTWTGFTHRYPEDLLKTRHMFRGPVGKGFGPVCLLAWPSGGIPVGTNLPCLRLSM